MKKDSEKNIKKRKARHKSIKEGVFVSARTSFGDQFISPFAIAINASNSAVALLTSIMGLLGPLSQTLSSRLIEKFSRKKIVLKAVLLESFLWLPMILLAILFHKNIITNILPVILLLTFSIYTILLNMSHPAWFSWMGDVVDDKFRGRWFAKRNLIIGFVSIVLAIGASFFLDYLKQLNLTMIGFAILFFLAFLSRISSWKILKQQYEPKIKLKKGYYFSFWEFILNAPKNNFGRFTIFRSLIAFSASISSPLVAVYLLRNLQFSYSEYIIITLGGTFVSLFFLELWGKFADKYGNYRTVIVAASLIPLIPILWIIHPSLIFLLLIPSAISGIAWAGLHLAAGNFIYDNVSKEKRGIAVSYFNMVWGIGVFFGAGLGALLIKYINTTTITPIAIIFIFSAIVRAIVAIWWIPKIKEVKKTRRFNSKKALKYIFIKQAKPTILEEVHEIISLKKYMQGK